MDKKIYTDLDKLTRILSAVSSFCIGKVRYFDDSSQMYIIKELTNQPFCSIMATCPVADSICRQCNKEANKACMKKKNAYCYYCHANLLEIVCPVYMGDTYIGLLSTGQYRYEKTIEDKKLEKYSKLTGVPEQELLDAYMKNAEIDAAGIKGAFYILESTAQMLVEENIFKLEEKQYVNEIETYVINHLSEKISLSDIASFVAMTPSYLSFSYHRDTGRTLSDFIAEQKIAQSMKYLRTENTSIAEIARKSGFRDANYFSKVFHDSTGYSPTEYRTRHSKKSQSVSSEQEEAL